MFKLVHAVLPLSLPQLLPLLKQVRFSVENFSVYFDENGDPPTGYDIVTWIWRGTEWSLREVGSYTADPTDLTVDPAQIEWGSDDGYTGKVKAQNYSICTVVL